MMGDPSGLKQPGKTRRSSSNVADASFARAMNHPWLYSACWVKMIEFVFIS